MRDGGVDPIPPSDGGFPEGAFIQLPETTIEWTYVLGSAPAPQTLEVAHRGTLTYSVRYEGQLTNWLDLSTTETAESTSDVRIGLAQTPRVEGTYRAFVDFTATSAGDTATANLEVVLIAVDESMPPVPAFDPEYVAIGVDDVIYLFDRETQTIYRRSTEASRYFTPIRLSTGATHVTYGAASHRIYVAYDSGEVTQIDLDAGTAETPFATVGAMPHGIATAGTIVVVADPTGAWNTHHTFLPDGTLVSSEDWNHRSREYAWSEATGRMYFFRDGTSPNDLHYESIDTISGVITGAGETPYHGDYQIAPPIRPSRGGGFVLLGSGDIYDGTTLEIVGALPITPADALWLPADTLITLREAGGGTELQQWAHVGSLFQLVNVQSFPGSPVRILPDGDDAVVVTNDGVELKYDVYQPTDDGDGDGVPFPDDAFPDDPAASVDSDGDGHPDAWNPGYTEADSTTGLVLDAFPNDAACWLPEHGLPSDPTVCDVDRGIPPYVPDQIVMGNDDTLYLFSEQHDRIFRWSPDTASYDNPIVLRSQDASYVAYGETNDTLYVAYDSGAITQIDTAAGTETDFAVLPGAPHGLATAGPIVLAADASGAWNTHYTFLASGLLISSVDWNYRSRVYTWSNATGRMYFFRDDTSPNDLQWESIDVATGAITGEGDSPYHGDYNIAPPIRVSEDGAFVLLGTGDMYDGTTIEVVDSLPISPTDAVWLSDGTLITIRSSGVDTTLEQWERSGTVFDLVNVQQYADAPLRVLVSSTAVVVVTQQGDRPNFNIYVPTNDGDGDGVPSSMDAFPLDPAASVDSDGDGYPDVWNPGYTQADSTTGLTLDAFPDDSACQLPSHALPNDPTTCDVANGIPTYLPDQTFIGSDGVIYLFSRAHHRIFRWSIAQSYHLNPFVLRASDAELVAYSAENQRLYVAYDTGAITEIDPATGVETTFAVVPGTPHGLATAGRVVFAADSSGGSTHHTFLPDGTPVSAVANNRRSAEYVWSSVTGRVYFTRDGTSPNDLHWESIDTVTGAITGAGESPYHGDFVIAPPIRVSQNGAYVLLGSGELYDATSLDVVGGVPVSPEDAAWLSDGTLLTLRSSGSDTLLEQWVQSGSVFETVNVQTFAGSPIRVLATSTTSAFVVTQAGAQPVVQSYTPTDDADGDGVPYLSDAFPNDVAASIDSDGDGSPDAWNPGYTQADSTTGLTIDAFPADSACQLASQALPGDPNTCDIAANIPPYVPDQVVASADGIAYMLSHSLRRVFRYDLIGDAHLNPIYLAASDASIIAHSAPNNRLYVAHDSGSITQIDLATSIETAFAVLPGQPHGLATAGPVVLAADPSGAWNTHYTFLADGTPVSVIDWNRRSPVYEWSPAAGRMYFFRSGTSPNDIHWEAIDTVTGAITADGESPYHGTYVMVPPIRVSPSGSHLILGSGDIFDALPLTYVTSLPSAFTDAAWRADGTLVTVRSSGVSSIAEHWSTSFTLLATENVPGTAVRVIASPAETNVISQEPGGLAFYELSF